VPPPASQDLAALLDCARQVLWSRRSDGDGLRRLVVQAEEAVAAGRKEEQPQLAEELLDALYELEEE